MESQIDSRSLKNESITFVPISVLPNEIFLMILEYLSKPERIVFGNCCRRTRSLAEPLIILFELKQKGKTVSYSHLIKRNTNHIWVCNDGCKRHDGLLHPSFPSNRYIENLKGWKEYELFNYHSNCLAVPEINILTCYSSKSIGRDDCSNHDQPIFGLPTCKPKEVRQYLQLLAMSSKLIKFDMKDIIETQKCGMTINKAVESIILDNVDHKSKLKTKLNLKQDKVIICHTNYTISFNQPRGSQRISINNTLKHAKEIRLDICQHIRLNNDEEDRGNSLLSMLKCSAMHYRNKKDLSSNHKQCFERVHGDFAEPIGQHWMSCSECYTETCIYFQPYYSIEDKFVVPSLEVECWNILSELPDTMLAKSNDWKRIIGPIEKLWIETLNGLE